MTQDTLTPKQRQVLNTIQEITAERGSAPTFREIADHLGYDSVGTVQDHIKALTRKGYLEQSNPGKARGLRPTLHEASRSIPILGKVPAGNPLEAIEDTQGQTVVSAHWRGDLYALQVRGDSMIEAGILEGDTVIVRAQNTAENGDIVVASIDGEATVKQLEKKNGRIRLLPANARYRPIMLDPSQENRIQGKVIALQRKFEK